jgi:hypothetical protein
MADPRRGQLYLNSDGSASRFANFEINFVTFNNGVFQKRRMEKPLFAVVF